MRTIDQIRNELGNIIYIRFSCKEEELQFQKDVEEQEITYTDKKAATQHRCYGFVKLTKDNKIDTPTRFDDRAFHGTKVWSNYRKDYVPVTIVDYKKFKKHDPNYFSNPTNNSGSAILITLE